MPLKHLTETVLVVALGIVTIFTGILIDTLPLLPQGFIPWAIVFGAALLYPLVLYPLFRTNRADYFFRVLHFLPAALALLWIAIQLVALRFPAALIVHEWYTFGWTVVGVVIVFVLILWFCFEVLRRRTNRMMFLLLLLVPFIALGISSELFAPVLDQGLSAKLWQREFFNIAGTGGSFFAGGPLVSSKPRSSIGANLSSSGANFSSSGANLSSSGAGYVSSTPPVLPSSGPGMFAGIGLFLAAVYSGTVHRRAIKRSL